MNETPGIVGDGVVSWWAGGFAVEWAVCGGGYVGEGNMCGGWPSLLGSRITRLCDLLAQIGSTSCVIVYFFFFY